MDDQHYRTIADAIAFLTAHADDQPSLDEAAARAGLSAFHFQRLFRKYAGVTPKQFLAHVTVTRAKAFLAQRASVLDTTLNVGLSSPARLHDHFVTIEAVTPGEYKSGGSGLSIHYGFAPSPFGMTFVARTERGICALNFVNGNGDDEVELLRAAWPNAMLVRDDPSARTLAQRLFADGDDTEPLRLIAKGTNFQLRVWNALLAVPTGTLASYRAIAGAVGEPQGARAVGNALASNPIGVLIPCHRIITSHGAFGSYRWGADRKRALIAWEAARKDEHIA